MKICFISNSLDIHAGLGRAVISIADEFSRRGAIVGVVSPQASDKYPFLKTPLKGNYRMPLQLFAELLKIRKFAHSFDIVVAFDARPVGILTHMALMGLNKNIIIHAFGTYALFEKQNYFKNLLVKWVYKKSKKVFVINSFVKRCIETSKKGFKFGSNMVYVPVGVDTKLFFVKENPTFKYAKNYILSVGAIKPRKGQLKSVQAFAKISSSFPDLHYIIVGDIEESSSYIHEIRDVIEKNDLKLRVHFLQRISDEELIDLYSGAQFFILTPVTTNEAIEGFAMVYLEAALCGATAIGTCNTGAEAAIEHGKSGLVVNDTVEDISNAIKYLLMDDKKRKIFQQYAHNRALLFDWSNVVDKYEKEIRSLEIKL